MHAVDDRATPYFDVAGAEGDRPIVLLHGSVVSRKMWIPQLQSLADEFRVIAVDLPGHGSLADVPFDLSGAASMVADVIRRHASRPPLVTGLSLGGYVAITLAAAHPELVGGLALCGCSVSFTGVRGRYLSLVANLMQRGWLRPGMAATQRKTRHLFPPDLEHVFAAQVAAGLHPDSLAPAFAELACRDFARLCSGYSGPVLIINGERDRVARSGAATFSRAVANCRVEIIAAAGHACSLDQPARFDALIRDFAGALAPEFDTFEHRDRIRP